MGAITAIGKLLLKNKKGTVGVIKSVAPFSKTGGKTVAEWKDKVKHKKYLDAIRDAGHEMTGKLKKSAEELKKLNETLKKQKKILDD